MKTMQCDKEYCVYSCYCKHGKEHPFAAECLTIGFGCGTCQEIKQNNISYRPYTLFLCQNGAIVRKPSEEIKHQKETNDFLYVVIDPGETKYPIDTPIFIYPNATDWKIIKKLEVNENDFV